MSQARPKPFRFTALPRELQERIASELDLGSLGRLSSTSKKLRASLIPLLFRHVGAPRSVSPCVPFPPAAISSIQTFNFRLDVGSQSSTYVSSVQAAYTAQLALLPFLDKVRSLQIHIAMEQDLYPVTEDLEAELSMDAAALRAVCSACPQAKVQVWVTDEHETDGEAVCSVLASLLMAFKGQIMESLCIKGCFLELDERNIDIQTEAAYQAFASIVPNIRRLVLSEICEVVCCPTPVKMPLLQSLHIDGLVFGDETRQRTYLRGIIALANACDSLEDLRLDLQRDELLDWPIILQGAQLQCPPLKLLRLGLEALSVLSSCLETISTNTLEVTLYGYDDWQKVERLLDGHLADLQELTLHVMVDFPAWSPNHSATYAHMSSIAQRRRIRIRLHVKLPRGRSCHVSALLGVLRCIGPGVESLRVSFVDHPFDPFIAYRDCTTVPLASLAYLDIEVAEREADSHPGSASDAFAAFLRHVQAPGLATFTLTTQCPTVHALRAVTKAIQSDTFPALRVLSGLHYLPPGSGSWIDPTRVLAKRALLQACSASGIVPPKQWSDKSRRRPFVP